MKVATIIVLLSLIVLLMFPSSAGSEVSYHDDEPEELFFFDLEEEILAEEDDDQELEVPEGPVECARSSPQEMYFLETQPRLLKTLDELGVCLEKILQKTEDALRILIPIMPDSPLGSSTINLEQLFNDMRLFAWDSLNQVFEDNHKSWYGLFYTHTTLSASVTQQLEAVIRVKESLEVGERILLGVRKEILLNIKAIIATSIHSIGATAKLHNSPSADEKTADVLYEELPQIAPNFLGTLMAKIITKGFDKKDYKKMDLEMFKPMLHPITQLVLDLGNLESKADNESSSTLEDLWLKTINSCHYRIDKSPIHEEDFEALFSNEEYLSELTLSLMAWL